MMFREFEVERAQTLREMCRVVPYLEEKHVTILVTREWHEIITKGVYPKDAGTETEKFLDSISTADCADFTKKFEEFSRTPRRPRPQVQFNISSSAGETSTQCMRDVD